MRSIVGGATRAAPPQVQPRLDLQAAAGCFSSWTLQVNWSPGAGLDIPEVNDQYKISSDMAKKHLTLKCMNFRQSLYLALAGSRKWAHTSGEAMGGPGWAMAHPLSAVAHPMKSW